MHEGIWEMKVPTGAMGECNATESLSEDQIRIFAERVSKLSINMIFLFLFDPLHSCFSQLTLSVHLRYQNLAFGLRFVGSECHFTKA
jgi:hypothetical protein